MSVFSIFIETIDTIKGNIGRFKFEIDAIGVNNQIRKEALDLIPSLESSHFTACFR